GSSGSYAGAATAAHQRKYFEALAQTNINFIYGEAFDQAWKKEGGGEMGQFGGHWGLWQDVDAPKEAVNTLYLGVRPGYNGAPQALPGESTAAGDAYFASLVGTKDPKALSGNPVWVPVLPSGTAPVQQAMNQMQVNYNAVFSEKV